MAPLPTTAPLSQILVVGGAMKEEVLTLVVSARKENG